MVIFHCRKTAAFHRQWPIANPKWKMENEKRLRRETFTWVLTSRLALTASPPGGQGNL
jgi:hypothetical protein